MIVATGMAIDRKLGVPGEDLPDVWGSWRFVAWLNGHPDFRLGPDLSRVKPVAVIGNGNVALDVARVLAKSAEEMAKSDIVPEAGAAIVSAPLTDIHVIGRRGPNTPPSPTRARRNGPAGARGRGHRAEALAWRRRRGSHARAAAQGQEPRDPEGFATNKPGGKPVTVHFRVRPASIAFNRARSS